MPSYSFSLIFLLCAATACASGELIKSVGTVPYGKPVTLNAFCYNLVNASVCKVANGANNTYDVTICFSSKRPKVQRGLELCLFDELILVTPEAYVTQPVILPSMFTTVLKGLTEEGVLYVKERGVQVYAINPSVKYDFKLIVEILAIMKGNNTVQANMDFLQKYVGFTYVERTADIVDISQLPPDYIRPGDIMIFTAFQSQGTLIMYGTGGRAEHVLVFVERDGQLVVAESSGDPGRNGTFYRPWKQWWQETTTKECKPKECMFSILRLKPEYHKMFDNAKANQCLDIYLKEFYGNENFMSTFFDTPNGNLPPPLDEGLFPELVAFLDKMSPMTHGIVKKMVLDALNLRLGNPKLDWPLPKILNVLETNNKSMAEVFAIPEQDSFRYNGRIGLCCSTMVTSLLKCAGAWGELGNLINAKEFTPKDVYQMGIWEVISPSARPKACQLDSLGYCQLFGHYEQQLPGIGGVPLYAHMNDHCPSDPRDNYFRPDNC